MGSHVSHADITVFIQETREELVCASIRRCKMLQNFAVKIDLYDCERVINEDQEIFINTNKSAFIITGYNTP